MNAYHAAKLYLEHIGWQRYMAKVHGIYSNEFILFSYIKTSAALSFELVNKTHTIPVFGLLARENKHIFIKYLSAGDANIFRYEKDKYSLSDKFLANFHWTILTSFPNEINSQ